MTSREQFDRQASHYDRQWNGWNEENLRWMLEHAACRGTEAVLDAGTGAGFTAAAFAPHAARVTGLDVSSGIIAQARHRAPGNVSFEVGPAEKMPFPDGQFDIVTCRMAAHHFTSVPGFLAESHRVLKPGGRLLIADTIVPDGAPGLDQWQNDVELRRDPSHQRNLTPAEWKAWLGQAGFHITALSDEGGPVRITLEDWLVKSGCHGPAAAAVRRLFRHAAPEIRQAFDVRDLENGDIAFSWRRIVICAVRAPR